VYGRVLQCVAVCCGLLQCVAAVCCSVLQCVAVCCSVMQCVAVCCSALQCDAVCCSVCCSVLQCRVCCSVLQCQSQNDYRESTTDKKLQNDNQIQISTKKDYENDFHIQHDCKITDFTDTK